MAFDLQQIDVLVRSRYSLLYVLTHEERRMERYLTRLGRSQHLDIYRWRATSGLVQPDGEVVDATREAHLALHFCLGVPSPAIFIFYDFHQHISDPFVIRTLRDLEGILADRGQAVLIVSPTLNIPTELDKDITLIEVPLPDKKEVGAMFDELAAQDDMSIHPSDRELLVRAALGLTANEIRRALTRIRMTGGQLDQRDVPRLIDEKRRAIRKSRFLEFYDQADSMVTVGGMDNLKTWLEQRALGFSDDARKYGLPSPRGLFLLGVQGCGKSLMAKAVAGLWNVPLLRLDVGAVFQVQERAELSLRETIRVAESLAPVVLWIDELEKGFLATKDEGGGRGLGTFLTWMQEKTLPVFVVATANDVRMLPPELLRKGRFDEIFFVDLPNVHERLAILEIHLRHRSRNPDNYDLTPIAEETERFSGAELEQVVVSALFNAYADGRDLHTDDLLEAAREMVPLAVTMDDRLKELREWARPRARKASVDTRRIDYFEDWVD